MFSVTHPDMDWTDYELSQERDFVLGEESDIFHHTKHHYLSALEAAGFELEEFRAVSVNEAIAHYLMPRSVERVRGRPQIAVVRAVPVNEAAT